MSYILHPHVNDSESRNNPQLLRIVLDTEFTRLDFGYSAISIYIKGGWFNIYPQTHLRVHGIAEPFPRCIYVTPCRLPPSSSPMAST